MECRILKTFGERLQYNNCQNDKLNGWNDFYRQFLLKHIQRYDYETAMAALYLKLISAYFIPNNIS